MTGRMYWLNRIIMVKPDFMTMCGQFSTHMVKDVSRMWISSRDWNARMGDVMRKEDSQMVRLIRRMHFLENCQGRVISNTGVGKFLMN